MGALRVKSLRALEGAQQIEMPRSQASIIPRVFLVRFGAPRNFAGDQEVREEIRAPMKLR